MNLRTPSEWAQELGIDILDPDGWRGYNGRPFTDAITAEEFDLRVQMCTIRTAVFGRLPKAVDLP